MVFRAPLQRFYTQIYSVKLMYLFTCSGHWSSDGNCLCVCLLYPSVCLCSLCLPQGSPKMLSLQRIQTFELAPIELAIDYVLHHFIIFKLQTTFSQFKNSSPLTHSYIHTIIIIYTPFPYTVMLQGLRKLEGVYNIPCKSTCTIFTVQLNFVIPMYIS